MVHKRAVWPLFICFCFHGNSFNISVGLPTNGGLGRGGVKYDFDYLNLSSVKTLTVAAVEIVYDP